MSWRSRAALGVFVTAVVVGIVLPGAVSGYPWIANPDYVGKGRFDRNMKIEFSLYEERGQRYLKFVAKKVKFI